MGDNKSKQTSADFVKMVLSWSREQGPIER